MTSAPTISPLASRARPVKDSRGPLRSRLKPKGPTTGWVDGGWRLRDLAPVLAVLAVRLGRIERVSYHLGDRGPTPGKLSCGGGVVRLGGYRAQLVDTVDVLAARQPPGSGSPCLSCRRRHRRRPRTRR